MSTNSTGLSLLSAWSSDMYAPSWASVYPQLPGFCDVDFDYPIGNQGDVFFTQTVLPGQQVLKIQVNIDTDADYLAREIYVAPINGSAVGASGQINPQDLKMRVRDGDGTAITSDWITANDLCGPLGPCALPLRKGTQVLIDLWNQGDGTLIVQAGFKGWKRCPCNKSQGPLPPYIPQRARFCKEWQGVRFEEYEYFYEFSNGPNALYAPWVQNLQPQAPNQIFARIPLQTDADADFLWRGTTGMIMRSGGPINQVPYQFFITFYNQDQVPLADLILHPGINPTPSGPSADLILSDGGGRMAPHWPEVFIPRGGTIQADILLKTPTVGLSSVQFSLRGFKVYDLADCKI